MSLLKKPQGVPKEYWIIAAISIAIAALTAVFIPVPRLYKWSVFFVVFAVLLAGGVLGYARWKRRASGMDRRPANRGKRKNSRRFLSIMLCAVMYSAFLLSPMNVYAGTEGLQKLNEQLSLFKELVAALVSSVGAVVLMWSIFKMGMAMQAGGNGSMEAQSIASIGGGILMMAAPQLILIFSSSPVS